jgi:hypothetical protein
MISAGGIGMLQQEWRKKAGVIGRNSIMSLLWMEQKNDKAENLPSAQ